jgi:hypothetical protein
MWPDIPIHSSPPARGIRGHIMGRLKIYAEESPGFPATNDLSRAITGMAAKAGDLLRALSAETGQRPGKGI